MAVGKSVRHLSDVARGQLLLESPLWLLLQALVQFSLGSELQDQIDPTLVVEIAEQTQDVWMPQMGLNLNFSPKMLYENHFILNNNIHLS